MSEPLKYTFGLRKIFRSAMETAQGLGHTHIYPEHYVLAMAENRRGMAIRMIEYLHVDPDALLLALQEQMPAKELALRFRPRPGRAAKRLMSVARQIARDMGIDFIGTEHLFLASVHDETPMARLLAEHGVTYRAASHALCRSYQIISDYVEKRSKDDRKEKEPPRKTA